MEGVRGVRRREGSQGVERAENENIQDYRMEAESRRQFNRVNRPTFLAEKNERSPLFYTSRYKVN